MTSGNFEPSTIAQAGRRQGKSSLNFFEMQKMVRQLKLEAELRQRPIILAEQKPSGARGMKVVDTFENSKEMLQMGKFIGSGEGPEFSKEMLVGGTSIRLKDWEELWDRVPGFYSPPFVATQWQIPPKKDVQQNVEPSEAQAGLPAPLGEDGPIKEAGVEFYSAPHYVHPTLTVADKEEWDRIKLTRKIMESMLRCRYLLDLIFQGEDFQNVVGRYLALSEHFWLLVDEVEGAKK